MIGQGYVRRLGLSISSDSEASSEKKTTTKIVTDSKLDLLHNATTNTSSFAPNTDESRQVGDKTVYMHYFKSMGLFLAACSLFFAALWGFFTNFPTICESIFFVFGSKDPSGSGLVYRLGYHELDSNATYGRAHILD
jgi:hypothetical protein